MELIDVNKHYVRDPNLKKKDVKRLLDWTKKENHLPDISEVQTILFLQKLNYDIESAQRAIDAYFTFKTHGSDMFIGRYLENERFKQYFNAVIYTTLPKQTPEGYTIVYGKALDPNPDHYSDVFSVKFIDMVMMSHLYYEGTSAGFVLVFDLQDLPHGFVKKFDPLIMKNFFYYVQNILPWKFKGVHFFNHVAFLDEVIGLISPAMQKAAEELLFIHSSVDELAKYVPKNCLPSDYGGSAESISVLHENIKDKIMKNSNIFHWEDKQIVDESKRFVKA